MPGANPKTNTMTPERLKYLLQNDPGFIAEWIILSNTNAVADRIADVGFNRPVGLRSINQALQILLDAGRFDDFVHVLGVPLTVTNMKPEDAAAVFGAVGVGPNQDTLGQALALNALRLWQAIPVGATAEVPTETVAVVTQQVPRAPTPTEEEKKRATMRYAIIGTLVVLTLVAVAVLIKVARR